MKRVHWRAAWCCRGCHLRNEERPEWLRDSGDGWKERILCDLQGGWKRQRNELGGGYEVHPQTGKFVSISFFARIHIEEGGEQNR